MHVGDSSEYCLPAIHKCHEGLEVQLLKVLVGLQYAPAKQNKHVGMQRGTVEWICAMPNHDVWLMCMG